MELIGKVIKFAWIPTIVFLFLLSLSMMSRESRENSNIVEEAYYPNHRGLRKLIKYKFNKTKQSFTIILVLNEPEEVYFQNVSNYNQSPKSFETQRLEMAIAMEIVNRKFSQMDKILEEKVEQQGAEIVHGLEVQSDKPVLGEKVPNLVADAPPPDVPPPNPNFLFHNKLPKSGSTTMKWLLVELSKKNGFKLDHQRYCINKGQGYLKREIIE